MAVGFVFFLSLSAGNKNQSGEVIVSGQAKQTTHIQEEKGSVTPAAGTGKSKGSSGWGWQTKTSQADVEKEVEDEVQKAESDFEKTIAEQLALQQPTIAIKVGSVMESTRKSLNKLLGDSDLVTSEDIENLGNEIENKLNRDVQKYLKEKTSELLEAEDTEMEIEADLETEDMTAEDETQTEEIISDLEEEKGKLLTDLREKIDQQVGDLLKNIKHMAGILAKEMLESLLKEKTGKTYKVYLDDEDNLVSFKKRSSTSTSTSTGTTKTSNTGTSKTKSTSSSSSSSGQSSTSSSHHKSSTGSTSTTSDSSSTHKSSTTKDATKPKGKKAKPANDDSDRRFLR